jgi:uncharacterized protein (TIGR02284 family)
MVISNDDVVSALTKLVKTSNDGEQGFRSASERAQDTKLKSMFAEAGQRCAEGALELQYIIGEYGGDVDIGHSASGVMHNAWTSVKSAVAGDDDLGILEEVERAEDVAKARYREALEEDLPSDVHALVERQYRGVVENHDRVRDLRNGYRAAS